MRFPGSTLLLPLFLAGCALPPAVTVASLFAGGVSYVTTGKGTTDHAISAIAHEDCALLRVVNGKPICDPDGEVLFALALGDPADENWHLDPEIGSPGTNAATRWGSTNELQATVERSRRGQFADARPVPKAHEPRTRKQTANRFTRQIPQDTQIATYAVIGSFRNVENAR